MTLMHFNFIIIFQQWAEVVLHDWSWIIPVFVFISSFGTMHASLFASGRQVERDF